MNTTHEFDRKVGFVGLGIMGGGMASNLHAAGFDLIVYNRTEAAATPLKEKGIRVADSLEEIARNCDIVMMCLSDDAAVTEVVQRLFLDEMTPLSLIIDLSTIAPSTVHALAKEAATHNISFIDAPVSGGDIGAREGTLSVMAGGSAKDFCLARPLFDAIGSAVTLCGPLGSGQMTKCVNQVVVALNVAAMTEGLAFAHEAGLDMETTLEVITKGAAGSWSLDNYAPRLIQNDLKPGFYAAHMLKDLRIALDEAERFGLPLPASSLVKELYTALCTKGGERLGNHALIALYEKLAGKPLLG